jgi:Protein of unknown function (DUF3455)
LETLVHRRIFTSLAAAGAVVASILITSPAASAADPAPALATTNTAPQSAGVTPNSGLDPLIQVPAGSTLVTTLRGVGKQVYDCKADGSGFAFREPVAGLFTLRGLPAAIHGKRPEPGTTPFWVNFDGSHVDGTVSQSVTPDPKSIPWLLLTAKPVAGTTGTFSNVAFIQRIDTRGGLAPTGTCTFPKTVAVDYTANYVFWAAAQPSK